ncbi:inorganic phosphate transporter Pho88 [Kalaharituber pfeilii]|nr:inorganic phosphate transporter Pho88 [Kalaharituber pfeilii]
MSDEKPKLITTTIMGHDLSQLRAAYKSVLMGVGMMVVMHVYFKYTNPLVIQSIIPLKGVFENKLVQVHLLGKPAVGDLKRPWKSAAGPFGGLGGDPQTDKKSVEGAERKGTGGAKEE